MPWPQSSGLGSGIANSWIEQYTTQPIPCINNALGAGAVGSSTEISFSSCLLWLVIGLAVGAAFTKKG